jgi:ATP-binding cassette subfamily A (ABC1) protein 3
MLKQGQLIPIDYIIILFAAFNENIKKNLGFSLTIQQFYGMFIKKVIHTRTNHVVTAVQLIMPVLFTIFGLLVEETAPN